MVKTIILDIETKPNVDLLDAYVSGLKHPANYKDQKKIDEWYETKRADARKQMSTDTDLCSIFCVGIKEIDEEPLIMGFEQACYYLNSDPTQLRFVTYNGKKFDIPTMIKMSAKLGVELPYFTMVESLRRNGVESHIDLYEILNVPGDYKKKDQLVEIYLGKKPTPIDFENCTDEELREHCKEDLILTEELYKLFLGKLYL